MGTDPFYAAAEVRAVGNGDPSPRKRALHLLVVDDETSVREVLCMVLTKEGHDVVTARNGCEGLEQFVKDRWDVVITDRSMPEMPGDELAAKIKHWSPSTPVILLTGFAGPLDPVGVQAGKFDLILHKPFTIASLCAGIEQVMNGKPEDEKSTVEKSVGPGALSS